MQTQLIFEHVVKEPEGGTYVPQRCSWRTPQSYPSCNYLPFLIIFQKHAFELGTQNIQDSLPDTSYKKRKEKK